MDSLVAVVSQLLFDDVISESLEKTEPLAFAYLTLQ